MFWNRWVNIEEPLEHLFQSMKDKRIGEFGELNDLKILISRANQRGLYKMGDS